jgi:hypothetical protein
MSSQDGQEDLPPAILFKYLPPERVDVFVDRLVSFTPPSRFNDILEFSAGVETFVGPQFRDNLFNEAEKYFSLDFLIEEFARQGLIPSILDRAGARAQLAPFLPQLQDYLRTGLVANSDNFLATLNSGFFARLFTQGAEMHGIGVLCLTDEPHNPVMWAHYAKDYTGFVVAFDAFHPWFWFDSEFKRPRVMPVRYDDIILSEFYDLIDAGVVPFLRKRPAWMHEREWRMFAENRNRSRHIKTGDISLFEIPADAFLGVLLGFRTPAEVSNRIIAHQVMHAPHVQLRMVRPDYGRGLLESVGLDET